MATTLNQGRCVFELVATQSPQVSLRNASRPLGGEREAWQIAWLITWVFVFCYFTMKGKKRSAMVMTRGRTRCYLISQRTLKCGLGLKGFPKLISVFKAPRKSQENFTFYIQVKGGSTQRAVDGVDLLQEKTGSRQSLGRSRANENRQFTRLLHVQACSRY